VNSASHVLTPLSLTRWLVNACFVVLFVALNFQLITLHQVTEEGSSVRLYHALTLLFLPLVALHLNRLLVFSEVEAYFAIALVSNLIAFARFGLNMAILQLLFSYLIYLTGRTTQLILGTPRALRMFRSVILLVAAVVLFKHLFFIEDIVAAGFHAPAVPILYSGGPNIEATWLGLLLLVTPGTAANSLVGAAAVVTFVLYGSRAGLVATAFAFATRALTPWRTTLTRLTLALLFAIALTLTTVLIVYAQTALSQRLLTLGAELEGDVGRIRLWLNGWVMLVDNPFGYGLGNAIKLLFENLGRRLPENNFHNIYLQIALDSGVIALLAYLAIPVRVLLEYARRPARIWPLPLFFAGYWVISMVEFTGYEALFWFLLGFYKSSYSAHEDLSASR
jgi:O-antigen ligase